MSNFLQSILQSARSLFPFLKQKTSHKPVVQTFEQFASKKLKRKVRLNIYLPPGYHNHPNDKYPLLIFNDGQDMEAVRLEESLEALFSKNAIRPIIVVGLFAGDRMQEYGTAKYPDYKKRGKKAAAYTQFIIKELLPFLEKEFRLQNEKAIAGFSLGGLSAFDIAWHYPNIFSKVGVFSGSFWWRSKPFDPKDPDGDRIAHEMVRQNTKHKNMQFWFQTGTLDEEADRNNNGIIDSIDDTRDLITELSAIGYHEGRDIHYIELIGGRHDTYTWGKILPDFLIWGFGV